MSLQHSNRNALLTALFTYLLEIDDTKTRLSHHLFDSLFIIFFPFIVHHFSPWQLSVFLFTISNLITPIDNFFSPINECVKESLSRSHCGSDKGTMLVRYGSHTMAFKANEKLNQIKKIEEWYLVKISFERKLFECISIAQVK